MTHTKYIILFSCLLLGACSKFLDQTPQGVIAGDDLNTPQNLEKMVVAAYSSLGNDHYTAPYSSMWPYGNIRSGDAYKGETVQEISATIISMRLFPSTG